MRNGRPKKINNRFTTSVSFEQSQIDFIKSKGFDISEFVRECVDLRIKNNESTLETLKEELKNVRKNIEDLQIKEKEYCRKIEEIELENKQKEEEEIKKNELNLQRIDLFNKKYRSLIFHKSICEIDFYPNIKKDLKMGDLLEAKEWLLKRYSEHKEGERTYSEDRIKTFLRWDDPKLLKLW